ncbi:MAG: zinc ribbon domain-containing protein [Desulfobacteraceae bacterium]|nr:zinc ribbon domain-containing protein [Desulfobacteraceae bacterium]
MCFFIAGVQPKTRNIETTARRCPRCGLYQAYLRQVDHYLSLFFIPLIPIKRGQPFLYCLRCQQPVGTEEQHPSGWPQDGPPRCRHCGRSIQADFDYCPGCGRSTHQ